MGKLTDAVFNESCCDGGGTTNDRSCQPCGCDKGAGWVCEQHRGTDLELEIKGWKKSQPIVEEVRVVDPKTGGEKGSKLARFDLIPPDVLWELAEHYGKGAVKYPPNKDDVSNWQLGYNWRLSIAALERHLTQFKMGEDHDAETGTSHLVSIVWHAIALRWFQLHEKGTDYRHTMR